METREHKHVDVVLMIDTSLSMTGKNLALAGVAAAVLALKLRATGLLAGRLRGHGDRREEDG